MVVGGITLFGILPLYEIWVSRRGKEPYLPLHLFTNVRFMSAAWNTSVLVHPTANGIELTPL